jgi:OmpA-OmpF porin, OOP family
MNKLIAIAKNRKRMLTVVAALGLTLSTSVYGQESGWSMGANVGQSTSKWDNDEISSVALISALTTDTTASDNKDTSFKVFFGYQFNQYFAIEAGYFDLGQSTFTMNTLPLGELNNVTEVMGVDIDAVAILPLSDMFAIFARFGANYAEVKTSFTGSGFIGVNDFSESNRETNYQYGAGVQMNFTENLAARLEMENYRLTNPAGSDDNVEVASLGLVYRFTE